MNKCEICNEYTLFRSVYKEGCGALFQTPICPECSTKAIDFLKKGT